MHLKKRKIIKKDYRITSLMHTLEIQVKIHKQQIFQVLSNRLKYLPSKTPNPLLLDYPFDNLVPEHNNPKE